MMGVSVVVCYFEKQQIENPFLLLSFFFVRAIQSRSQSALLAREIIRDWNLRDSYFALHTEYCTHDDGWISLLHNIDHW